MSAAREAVRAFAWLIAAAAGIVTYGIFWLYENIDTLMAILFVIVISPALFALWIERRRRRKRTAAIDPTPGKNADITEKSHVHASVACVESTHDKCGFMPDRARVHVIDNDGKVKVDWREMMMEVERAWQNKDYDFARTWLQKLAYLLHSKHVPEAVHERFKTLVAAFAQNDPLYKSILSRALPAIEKNPRIMQSQLMRDFPDFSPEEFRYAMYYTDFIGEIRRKKKGRSYLLTLPGNGKDMTDAEILDAYVALSVSLREALRAHDQDAAFDAATRMVDMGERIVSAKARMETEGIRRGDGFIRGGGGLFVRGAEFDYLTGRAYQLGKVDAPSAIHYCDMAIEWAEASLRAILAWRDRTTGELSRMRPAQAFLVKQILARLASAEADAEGIIEYWRGQKKEIEREEAGRKRLLDLLAARQGILQSEFLRQCPEADSETIYYAALRGEIIREKKGRSFHLTLPA
jgi:hypothetical protein